MTEEVGRRLIDGVWVTNVEAQGGSGGGGITRVTSDDETVTIINPTGPTVDLSASGGSQPVAESLIGTGSAADGDGGNISFGTLQGGPLLDYTTPAVPVVISAGFYIFAGYCKCNDGTQISGSFSARAVLSGTDVAGLVLGTTSLQDAGTTGTPSIPLCAAGQLEAGDAVFVAFTNGSGIVGTLNFLAEMTIVKL